jgi:hypothetical protein
VLFRLATFRGHHGEESEEGEEDGEESGQEEDLEEEVTDSSRQAPSPAGGRVRNNAPSIRSPAHIWASDSRQE